MAYRVFLSEDRSYVIIEVTGDITPDNSIQFNLEAHRLGREHGIKKYLSNLTLARNKLSVIENYDFSYRKINNAPDIDLNAVIAMLVAPDDHSHDFIETLARNNGVNVTIFRDMEQAIEYLKEN